MPYSYTQLPGDGSNTNFTFAFGYLSKSHVSATINGTSTPFSWLTDFSIQITPAPAAGTIVEIRRKTPLDAPIVDWSDGSVITEHDMDLNTLFSLYLAQEAQDGVDATIHLNSLGKWDGLGREAINFADPTSSASLITKGFFDSVYAPALDAKVTAAANSATASANSAGQSATSAASASSSASAAAATLALFRGQYLGAQASNPTVDGNGDPITAGDLYFNTSVDEMRVYNGSGWVPVGSTVEGTMKRPPGYTPIIATAGQTTVPVSGGYDPYNIIAIVNGVAVTSPDVDVSSGTSLVFAAPLSAGDEVDYYAFGLLSIANTFTKSELLGSGGASNIGLTPSGGISSATVQAALNELDTKKALVSGDSTKTFSVANASLAQHAITMGQADSRYAAIGSGGSKLTSVAASVASNALTIGLNPTVLDFRSPTLSNGAPNTRTLASPIFLVVPSGATLGTVNAIASRLAILAIDNSGTVELAIVNMAGGNNLDETTLINTTAVSAGATAGNVIYSTTARTGVPFRVVGYIESTQAVAGTWASALPLVQGIGGQALTALHSIGYGQSWAVVTGSRTSGTTYYNTTGRPIFVSVLSSAGISTSVNGTTIATSASGIYNSFFIVPPGGSYIITASILIWSELR